MSKLVIVPNTLSEKIYAAIDAALVEYPDAGVDREYFYQCLLRWFDENGYIPEFTLKPSTPRPA